MRSNRNAVRVGGTWLAIASALIIAVLALHGPIAPDHAVQMTRIADRATVWKVAHWMAAAAFSLYAVAGLILLNSETRLTDAWWTMTAWAVVPVGALWTLTTAVAEATVVASAAVSGNSEVYEAWWAFAEGKANGFAIMALAIAAIAGNDARSVERVTPTWSALIAMVAAVASFFGWALGMWFGIGLGGLLWVASSILMSAWFVWFGVAISQATPMRGADAHAD